MVENLLDRVSEKETGRLEAFSDGVFAVAITLLVFNLKVPSSSDPTYTAGQLAKDLAILWPSYLTFFISFATILIMWVNHHNMFKLVHKSNAMFMFANGFLLLLVTLVPFPTQLVASYLRTPAATTACAVYAGLFVVINIAYNLLWFSAAHQRRLLKANIAHSVISIRTRVYLLGFPGYLLALITAFWNPLTSIGICGMLWLFWALVSYERKPIPK